MSEPAFTSVSELRAKTAEVLARLKADHVPVVLTDDGRSEAVLLDIETYGAMKSRLALLEGIAEGDFAQGLVVAHDDVRARLDWWRRRT